MYRLFRYVSAFVVVFFMISGCTVVPPKDSNVGSQIDQALQQSISANRKVDNKNKSVSRKLSDSLMPALNLKATHEVSPESLEPRFDVSVHNVPAKTFFLGLIKGTKYNITVSPKIDGLVTLDLKNVTVKDALKAVQDLYGYDYEETAYGFRIFPRKLQTRIFTVNYLNVNRSGKSNTTISSGQITRTMRNGSSTGSGGPVQAESSNPSSTVETDSKSDFWQELQSTLALLIGDKGGHSVVVNPQSGLVIVKAYPDELSKVSDYLDSIQNISERQVIIEAKILEVTLSANFQAGINWKALGLSQTGLRNISDDLNFDQQTFDSFFTLNATAGGDDPNSKGGFSTAIQLLNTQGKVNVLSSPRIAALNNEKAVIKVGDDEFFVTNVSSNTAISGSSTTEVGQNISLTPFFSGIALDVTPQINNDGEVILHIHPIISSVTEQTKEIILGGEKQILPLAKSSIRESDNIVRAKNGQVIIIGGLMENASSDHFASAPGAEKIPALGGLFQDRHQNSRKMELVILLKPTVIGNGSWRDKLHEMARNFRSTNKEFKYEIKKRKR